MGEVEVEQRDAPGRDPNPRGPDAPDQEHAHEARPQSPPDEVLAVLQMGREVTEEEIARIKQGWQEASGKPRLGVISGDVSITRLGAVSPPPIRWIGTNYNFDKGNGGRIGIVIHTEVGTNVSATGRFQQPNQASAHYGVAYDGHEVVQWVSEADTAWHCGRYYSAVGYPIANWNAIGIEHEDDGFYNSPRPDGLYETSARLVAWICSRYSIPCDRAHIRKHSEVSIVGTACPDALDIDRIVTRAQQLLNPAPPAPTWRASFHAENYSVSVDHTVGLYDMETGSQVGTAGPGTIATAYRGTYKGTDWRVTSFSWGQGVAHGFKASELQPVPEWRKNLVPANYSVQMDHAVNLYDLTTGKSVKQVAAGPVQTQFLTTVSGVQYRLTQYSIDHNEGLGFRADELIPTPEWKQNLRPMHNDYQLVRPIALVSLETGKEVSQIGPGPLSVDYMTAVGGRVYRMTSFSATRNVPNGFLQASIDAAILRPGPTPPEPIPPAPIAPSLWDQIVAFFRKLLGG